MVAVVDPASVPFGVYFQESTDYAERYFMDGDGAELSAYKFAYAMKDAPHGVNVKKINNGKIFVVEIFTDKAKVPAAIWCLALLRLRRSRVQKRPYR